MSLGDASEARHGPSHGEASATGRAGGPQPAESCRGRRAPRGPSELAGPRLASGPARNATRPGRSGMHPRNLIDLIRAVGAISVFTLSLLGSATAGAGTIQKVSVSPSSLVAGNTATVVVEGTGSCSRVELSFGDGAKANLSGKLATLPAPTLSAPHPYPAPGTFTITARAARSDCSGGTKSVSLTVLPQGTKAPSTSLGAAAARAAAGAPRPVTESLAMLTGLAIRGVQTEFAEAGSPVVVRLEGTGSAVCQGLVLDFGDKTKPLTLDGRLPF